MTDRYTLISRDWQHYDYCYLVRDTETGAIMLETNRFACAIARCDELNNPQVADHD